MAVADFSTTDEFFTPAEMFTPECHDIISKDACVTTASDIYKDAVSTSNFKIIHFKKHIREWKFDDISKLIEFHMTHHGRGNFGREHFNADAMKRRYGEGSISFHMPYITVLAVKQ